MKFLAIVYLYRLVQMLNLCIDHIFGHECDHMTASGLMNHSQSLRAQVKQMLAKDWNFNKTSTVQKLTVKLFASKTHEWATQVNNIRLTCARLIVLFEENAIQRAQTLFSAPLSTPIMQAS